MKYQAVRDVVWPVALAMGFACSAGSGGRAGAPDDDDQEGGQAAGAGNGADGGKGGTRSGGKGGSSTAGGGNSAGAGADESGGGGGSGGAGVAGGSGAASGGAAGKSPDAGVPDPAALPPGKPAFIAQGNGGRIMVSCDNGRSWTFEKKVNSSNGDHEQYAAHGLAFGNGVVIALFGWGTPALIEYSNNGKDWLPAAYSGNALSEPMFEGGFFAAGGGHVGASSTNGRTWSRIASHGGQGGGIVRGYGSGTVNNNPVFVGVGANRYVVSLDNGLSWQSGSGPANCADNVSPGSGDIVGAGDGQIFVVTSSGNVCRTADGKAWTSAGSVGSGGITDVVWANGQLFAYQGARVSRSANGSAWTATDLLPANVNIAHATRVTDGPNAGTWAGVNRDGSQFFHSTDGITWIRAQGGSAGTNMVAIVAAAVQPGGACP